MAPRFGGRPERTGGEALGVPFFDSLSAIGIVVTVAAFTYVGLVAMLRIAGKRAIAKMNAFDLVVTVALGSTLATTFLSNQTTLSQGLAGIAALLVLQFAVSWLASRWRGFRGVVVAEPRLLLHEGKILEANLKKERLSRKEVLAAVRAAGYVSLDQVQAVVLETDGAFSVMSWSEAPPTALQSVVGRPAAEDFPHTSEHDK